MATTKKQKALGAKRASRAYNKKVDGGLRLIKVWVAGPDVDPSGVEAARVRNYAAKQPVTKAVAKAIASAE